MNPTSRGPVDVIERRYTASDLAAMPTELPSGPVRYELDEGRLITMVPPGDEHGAVEAKVSAALFIQGEQRGHGRVRVGEVGVVLWRDPDRVVGADAVFLASAQLPVRRSPEGYLETIPAIVVEVLSKNDTRAYVERKTSDYLRAGAGQVWLIDPPARTLTVRRAEGAAEEHGAGDVLRLTEVIPGFELRISDLFED